MKALFNKTAQLNLIDYACLYAITSFIVYVGHSVINAI
jgi:hypothetical protein